MRRTPNPWVVVPVLAGAVVGGALGWTITDIGCRPEGCLMLTFSIAFVAAIVTGFGVGVIVVLALRSMEEFHDANARGEEPPGPGCEVPDHDE